MVCRTRRLPRAVTLAMAVSISAGCSTTSAPPETGTSSAAASASSASHEVHVVGLGDSVPAAAGCDCTSFVLLYGQDVQQQVGRPTIADNLARDGLTTAGLLNQLSEPAVEQDVARADLVTVTVGANDFGPSRNDYFGGTCGGPDGLDCVRAVFPQLEHDLTAVLARIRALAAGHPVGIRVTNYWNVFEAGEVAKSKYGDAFPAQSDRLTREVNRVICEVTVQAGDRCIDVYTAFQDASPGGDPTALLAPDGDHPNQAGHELIARTIAAAGYAPL